MRKQQQPSLNGPIPGSSLTTEPRSRPWEKPAKLSTVTETAEYYLDKLSAPKPLAKLLDKIEEGAPLTLIADTFQEVGVMKGIHSLDVGILITPVLIEFMKAMAEQEEIEYVIGTEDEDDEADEGLAMQVVSEIFAEKSPVEHLLSKENMEDVVAPEEEEEKDTSKGLMSRASAEEI